MSQYYNPRRNRNLFNPAFSEPYTVSRSQLNYGCNLKFT